MDKPKECIGCPLHGKSMGFSQTEGTGSNGVLVVGEALGEEEARDGLPFRPKAAAGSKLEEAFKIVEGDMISPVRRGQFKLWNLCACRPPYNKLEYMPWERDAILHCRNAYFNDVVDSVKPYQKDGHKVILALGNLPLKYLTAASGVAKEKQSITHLRGYVMQSPYGLVVPSLHPSAIKRGKPWWTPLLVSDVRKALEVANGTFVHRWHPDYIAPKYNDAPSLEDAYSFCRMVEDNRNLRLTYDIETPKSAEAEEDERDELDDENTSNNIIMVQFSVGKNSGIAIPYEGEYINIIDRLLTTPNTKANHNTWRFDNPRLKAKGHSINGRVHDTMWMFKHYQPNLPRGLQSVVSLLGFPFPWKHFYGSKLAWYGCADVDAVQWIIAVLPGLMKELGVWQGYLDHVQKLYTLTLSRASEVGIAVNDEKRLNLKEELEGEKKELYVKMQSMVPLPLRNLTPKKKDKETGEEKYGYKREPAPIKKLRAIYEAAETKLGRPLKKSFNRWVYEKLGGVTKKKSGDVGWRYLSCKIDGEDKWCKVHEFTPSMDQVIRYIKWKHKDLTEKGDKELASLYVVPTIPKIDKETGARVDKETTGKQVLQDLIYETGDTLLETISEYRSVSTTISNFIPNWKPDSSGRVHTEWGFTAPTGQKDSRRPNILNCSKHTDNGQRFRGIIEAPVDHVYVEMDKKSFHVATMGFLANSRDYIRFSQIDPHSIFTSYIMPSSWGKPVDLSLSDDEIREYCAYIKGRSKNHDVDLRQKVAKPCVLGNQLGLGHRKLYKQNRKYINDETHAKQLQLRLNGIFDNVVPKTQQSILEQAHRYPHRLLLPWGRVQWFHEVFSWRYSRKWQKWMRVHGPMAEKALAFPVQGLAFGEIDWNLLEAEDRGYNEKYNFVNSIHDSVMFMPHIRYLVECIQNVYNLFTRYCSVLVNEATGPLGLKVGVEVSVGKNWRNYHPEKNPEGMRELKGKELREVYGIAA